MDPRPDFDRIVADTRTEFTIRVRKWRTSMSGCAWQVRHPRGKVVRWIESPRPRSALSLSIFLHEVGHHVIGFDRFSRRCEEEYHVWLWAMDRLKSLNIDPGPAVDRRFNLSMQYALAKAMRRGLRSVPADLQVFAPAA